MQLGSLFCRSFQGKKSELGWCEGLASVPSPLSGIILHCPKVISARGTFWQWYKVKSKPRPRTGWTVGANCWGRRSDRPWGQGPELVISSHHFWSSFISDPMDCLQVARLFMMVLIMGKVLLGVGGGVGWNEQLLQFMTPKQPSTEVMWLPGTNKTRTSQAYNGVCVNNINDDVNAPFLPTPTHTYAHIHMRVCIYTHMEKAMAPHSSTLAWKIPWTEEPGRLQSDTTERLHFYFSLSCIGEGNGNPLQCSCLENPRDGGAWWAAV